MEYVRYACGPITSVFKFAQKNKIKKVLVQRGGGWRRWEGVRVCVSLLYSAPCGSAREFCGALACGADVHAREQQIPGRMRSPLFWLKMPSVSKTAANASPQTEKPSHYTWVEPPPRSARDRGAGTERRCSSRAAARSHPPRSSTLVRALTTWSFSLALWQPPVTRRAHTARWTAAARRPASPRRAATRYRKRVFTELRVCCGRCAVHPPLFPLLLLLQLLPH